MPVDFHSLGDQHEFAYGCTANLVATGLVPGNFYSIMVPNTSNPSFDSPVGDFGSPTYTGQATAEGTWGAHVTFSRQEWLDLSDGFQHVWYLHNGLHLADQSPISNRVEGTSGVSLEWSSDLSSCPLYQISRLDITTAEANDDGIYLEWTPPEHVEDIGHFLYTVEIAEKTDEPNLYPGQLSGVPVPLGQYIETASFQIPSTYLNTGQEYHINVRYLWSLEHGDDLEDYGIYRAFHSNLFLGNFRGSPMEFVDVVSTTGDWTHSFYSAYGHEISDNSTLTIAPGSSTGNYGWLVSEHLQPNTVHSLWKTWDKRVYKFVENWIQYLALILSDWPFITFDDDLAGRAGNPYHASQSEISDNVRVSNGEGIISWGPVSRDSSGHVPSGIAFEEDGSIIPPEFIVTTGLSSLVLYTVGNPFSVDYTNASYVDTPAVFTGGLVVEGNSFERTLTWDEGVSTVRDGLNHGIVYRIHRASGPFFSLYSPSFVVGESVRIISDWLTEPTFVDDDPLFVNTWYIVECAVDLGDDIEGPWRYIGASGVSGFSSTKTPQIPPYSSGNYSNYVCWTYESWENVVNANTDSNAPFPL